MVRSVGRTPGVKDSGPRKRREGSGKPDSEAYRYADSGCRRATKELGKQSSCLECPFQNCILK